MTEFLVVLVAGLAVIAAATLAGPRLGVAAPLLLVAVGVVASFLPAVSAVEVEPEWILEGVLPPLLYSAAVSMPAMNFRRAFGAISGLSVLLVVGNALLLGVFFALVLPGLGFAWGVALGAIISPTDAVATSIIKQTSVSRRVVAILDGESLLNDATALVVLRTAVFAAGATFSFWSTLGTFAYSVVVAAVVGWLVGTLNLLVRKRVSDPTVNTVISFAVPFVASVPTGLLGGSGLVAAVVAGLITGVFAPRDLSPQNRLSDSQNWRTVELVLEGAVFLLMGVQLRAIVADVERDHAGVASAILVAVGALGVTLAVRAAYVAPLLVVLRNYATHGDELKGRLQEAQEHLDTPEGRQQAYDDLSRGPGRRRSRRPPSERQLSQFARRITQVLANIDYFRRERLGWREGTVIVWAGMRGAVTVAAAQTLPADTPQRSVLVLVAYAVAALSLLLQGGTCGPLVRLVAPAVDPAADAEHAAAERAKVFELMRASSDAVPEPAHPDGDPDPATFEEAKRHRLAVLAAQRSALLDARDNGTFDADVLEHMLANLDASQIDLEMRGAP